MKLWDKIKQILGIGKRAVKALPEAQQIQNAVYDNKPITLQRNDGTSIMIYPKIDRIGNQMLKSVLNHNTGEMQYLGEYTISDDALANIDMHGTTISSIYMNIDNNALLSDENYRSYVANVLLSRANLPSIINDYEHYAGEVNRDPRTGELYWQRDYGIAKGLAATRNENYRIYTEAQARKDAENRRVAEQKAKGIVPHIEQNGEGILKPEDNPYQR